MSDNINSAFETKDLDSKTASPDEGHCPTPDARYVISEGYFPKIVSHKRSLVLLGFGALIGLAMAAYGLFTAPKTMLSAVPRGALVLVNQRQILERDFTTQLKDVYGIAAAQATAEQRKSVLESMIAEELLVQRGIEIDLASTDPDVRGVLSDRVRQQISTDVVAENPSTEQILAFFAAHRDMYVRPEMFRVRDLRVPLQKKDALKVARQASLSLQQGAEVAAVMKKFGLEESVKVGAQELDSQSLRLALGSGIDKFVIDLSSGQASEPVATENGVHLLLMVKRNPAVRLEFAEVQKKVALDFKRDAQERHLNEYVTFLRGKANILFASGYSS